MLKNFAHMFNGYWTCAWKNGLRTSFACIKGFPKVIKVKVIRLQQVTHKITETQ